MPKFYFKLIDTTIVTDCGVHDLPDQTAAQIAAIELAQSMRDSRPELLGRNCSLSVTDEHGADICIIPLDHIQQSSCNRNDDNTDLTQSPQMPTQDFVRAARAAMLYVVEVAASVVVTDSAIGNTVH